jgi:hypothetical protein
MHVLLAIVRAGQSTRLGFEENFFTLRASLHIVCNSFPHKKRLSLWHKAQGKLTAANVIPEDDLILKLTLTLLIREDNFVSLRFLH